MTSGSGPTLDVAAGAADSKTGGSPASVLDVLQATEGPAVEIAAGLHGEARTMSRTELQERGARAARHFRDLGLEKGDAVLVALSTGPMLVTSILGAWYAGGCVSCVAPSGPLGRRSLSKAWMKGLVDAVRPKIIVGEAATLALAREIGSTAVPILADAPMPRSSTLGAPDVSRPSLDDVAILQLSSGSTGEPRAIEITHGNILSNVESTGERIGGTTGDRFLSWLPLHHDMGLVGGLLFPLYHRLPLRLIPTEVFVRSPMSWLEAMSEFRASLSPAPAFAYSMLAYRIRARSLAGLDLSAWRIGFIGAETIYAEVLEQLERTLEPCRLRPTMLTPCYGLAEATLAVAIIAGGERFRIVGADLQALRSRAAFEPRDRAHPGAVPLVGLGRPLSGVDLVIAGEHGEPLPSGRVGRILVRGPGVTKRIRSGDRIETVEGHLDTGDLGFLDAGELFFAGRAKELIVRGGDNIAPAELERVADHVEGVRRGCVAAFGCVRPESGRDEVVVLAETRTESARRREQLEQELRRRIAAEAKVQVDTIVFVGPGSLPKTTSGKIRRALCRELYLKNELRRDRRPFWRQLFFLLKKVLTKR